MTQKSLFAISGGQEEEHLHERVYAAFDSLVLMDSYAADIVSSIPAKIDSAIEAVRRKRRQNNIERSAVGTAIALGGFLGNVGGIANDDMITTGEIISRVGQFIATGGFSGDRFRNIDKGTTDCNVGDFNAVMNNYAFLFDLQNAYAPYLGYDGDPSALPEEWQPDSVHYFVAQMGIDLRSALSCVLNDSAGSTILRDIGDLVDVLESRLTATNRLIALLEAKRQQGQQQQQQFSPSYQDQFSSAAQNQFSYSPYSYDYVSNFV